VNDIRAVRINVDFCARSRQRDSSFYLVRRRETTKNARGPPLSSSRRDYRRVQESRRARVHGRPTINIICIYICTRNGLGRESDGVQTNGRKKGGRRARRVCRRTYYNVTRPQKPCYYTRRIRIAPTFNGI